MSSFISSVVDRIGAGAACVYSNERKETIFTPAGYLCSSYHAELVAIKAAWVTPAAKLDGNKTKYLFCTDSQSSIQALTAGPLKQRSTLTSSIWRHLLRLVSDHPESKVVFQFVFSHWGVERNEDADHAADVALKDPRSFISQEKCAIRTEKNSQLSTH